MSSGIIHPKSSRIAVRSLPYAIPFTVGLVCLIWGGLNLVEGFGEVHWVLTDLVPALVVLTIGTCLIFFGGIGAFSVAVNGRHEP